jgi:hypothetical protein
VGKISVASHQKVKNEGQVRYVRIALVRTAFRSEIAELGCFTQPVCCSAAIPDRANLNLLEFTENMKTGTLRRNWKHSSDNSVDATF